MCRLCQRNYKDRSGIYSNFLKHLKRAHPFEYNKTWNIDDQQVVDDNLLSYDEQQNFNVMDVKQKENRIVLSITKNLIVRCNMPFNLVEKPAFRDFMKDCNVKFRPISSRKLKRDIIPSLADIVSKRIHEALRDIEHVTLTVDIWSNRRSRSFLGITCHFIDDIMTPRAYLIDLLRFKSPHNSEAICKLTEDILDKFNLKNKVFRIVTDNAAAMVKAYRFGIGKEKNYEETNENLPLIIDNEAVMDEFEGDQCLFVCGRKRGIHDEDHYVLISRRNGSGRNFDR